ncbi:MAG: ABC-2 transporter permease [Lachnospiraceae bacterium]|nr:ABC-2 transporter permease [Lachnospiraceae bacterium]
MKALMIKDTYSIWKQMKLMVLMVVIFSVVPTPFLNIFAVTYASMIPYTAAALDEQSRWPAMAAMMPYRPMDMVLSKYALGWIFIGGAMMISLVAGAVRALVMQTVFTYSVICIGAMAALVVMSITMPLIFKFGVEKGRLVVIFLIALICGSAAAVSKVDIQNMPVNGLFLIVGVVVTVVISGVSVFIACRIYERSMR